MRDFLTHSAVTERSPIARTASRGCPYAQRGIQATQMDASVLTAYAALGWGAIALERQGLEFPTQPGLSPRWAQLRRSTTPKMHGAPATAHQPQRRAAALGRPSLGETDVF